MKLIIYDKGDSKTSKRLHKELDVIKEFIKSETLHEKEKLAIELSRNPFDKIAVLLTTKKDDLHDILSIKESFEGVRVILILPDGKPETVSRAWTIRPRFLSYSDGDFKDVFIVLKKMVAEMGKRGMA